MLLAVVKQRLFDLNLIPVSKYCERLFDWWWLLVEGGKHCCVLEGCPEGYQMIPHTLVTLLCKHVVSVCV